MDGVFLDTNVIVDYLTARQPFGSDALKFFEAAEEGTIKLYASTLSLCNIAYIIRKLTPNQDIQKTISDLTSLLTLTPIDSSIIQKALLANYKDFEDAVQYQSALSSSSISHFVTRNKSDFQETNIPIMSPTEYWNPSGFEEEIPFELRN